MKVFHGSLVVVDAPKILPRQDGHTCDFGCGFYTTTSLEQAERWVEIRKRANNAKIGFLNEYEIPDGLLESPDLKILKFDFANEEWLDFVVRNRSDLSFSHDFDLVYGSVANDNVYATINLYEDGFLNKQEAVKRLKAFALVNQILFHTERALEGLKFLGAREL